MKQNNQDLGEKIMEECARHEKELMKIGVKSHIEAGFFPVSDNEVAAYSKINATGVDEHNLMMEFVKDIRDDVMDVLGCSKEHADKTMLAGITFSLVSAEED